VQRIDTLEVSNGDSDHAGGLQPLFENMAVGRVISGEPERLEASLAGAEHNVETCASGTGWSTGLAEVHLWHAGAHAADEALKGNDASCVLTVRLRNADLILPGDISAATELRWLEAGLPEQNGERVVVAAHHGSRTSSEAHWVEAVAADHVIYTAGYRHHYGHPHPDVVARYERSGARAYNTAHSGALRLRFPPGGRVEVERWRERAPFWIRPASE